MTRSLHLRRGPHAVRPLRRRAVVACAPTTSARSRSRALMERNPEVDWAAVDDVIYGCANQAGEDNRNVGAHGAAARRPAVEVPGATVNRLCGSSMDAVGIAARAIKAGEAALMIAGGVESMTPRAVRDGEGRRARSRAQRRSTTRRSAGASSIR